MSLSDMTLEQLYEERAIAQQNLRDALEYDVRGRLAEWLSQIAAEIDARKELPHTREQANDQARFYLDHGWLTPEAATLMQRLDDGQLNSDDLGLLDSYLHTLKSPSRQGRCEICHRLYPYTGQHAPGFCGEECAAEARDIASRPAVCGDDLVYKQRMRDAVARWEE